MEYEWRRGDFLVSTDPARLDLEAVHRYLSAESYWAAGIPLEVVRRSVEHSLALGLYHGERQIGFARWITDRATFAYLADVYVLEEHRGQGLGVWLVECATSHPAVQGQRGWLLATRDAHGLYRRFGFTSLPEPARYMKRSDPEPYLSS